MNKGDVPGRIDLWKKELTDYERDLFQFLYDYYKEKAEWPYTRIVHLKFKNHIPDLLGWGQKLGYQFIRTGNPQNKDNKSSLSIFGVALCKGSEDDVILFMNFIKLAVKKMQDNPMDDEISDIDIQNFMPVSKSDLLFLRHMLNGSGLTNGISYNKTDNSFNGTLDFTEVMKYENCETFEDYIHLNLDHIPKIRFGGNYKRTYVTDSTPNTRYIEDSSLLDTSILEDTEIEKMKVELGLELKKYNDSHFSFSVFISHADLDYPALHDLLLEMINNKVKPIVWFRIIKDKSVRDKLIEEIHKADIFLIYLSKKSVISQLTNNEIGFVEGKKYFQQQTGDIVLRLFDKNLSREDCKGFYGLFDDGKSFDSKSISDRNEVIETLFKMKGKIGEKRPYESEKLTVKIPPAWYDHIDKLVLDGYFIDTEDACLSLIINGLASPETLEKLNSRQEREKMRKAISKYDLS